MNIKAKLTSLALAGTLALSLTPSTFAAISPTTFHDVKTSDWYYSAVDHVVTHGYFNGVGDSTFAPSGSMSRAMAVTVLARMFGGDLSGYTGKTDFADVPAGAYYAKAVQWAVEQGIASGTSATTFSPDAYATREQISVFLYNAVKAYGDLGTFNSTVLNGFTDRGRVSSWADTALQWATYHGIINGDNGQVKPKDSTTRAAFATISMNYDTKYQGSSTTPTPDPKPDPSPTPTPDPDPKPDPMPTPSEDEFVTSKEDEINNLLVAAWGSHAPTRDTGKLSQAARLIASGDIREVEPALKNVGFDKPLGTVQEDKYTTSRYDARSFVTTSSDILQALDYFRCQDNVQDTNAFTEYGIGVYKVNEIQFRVAIVTYGISAQYTDWDSKNEDENAAIQEEKIREVFAPVFSPETETPGTSYTLANGAPITQKNVLSILYGMMPDYPEGMPWTERNTYTSNLGIKGRACGAYVLIFSDAIFGQLPISEKHSDFSRIRVGDYVTYNTSAGTSHTVVVLMVKGNTITVTEGNHGGIVHWFRTISREELVAGSFDVRTRYPI